MVLHVFTSFLGGVPLCIPYGLYSGTSLGGTTRGILGEFPNRVLSGYVNQVDHGMSWAQGNENYYATQDTDHGYRLGIWEQRKHLKTPITFPSDDDYSSGHDYRSNCNQIDEHF